MTEKKIGKKKKIKNISIKTDWDNNLNTTYLDKRLTSQIKRSASFSHIRVLSEMENGS